MNRHLCLTPFLVLFFCLIFIAPCQAQRFVVSNIPIQLCFTPGGNCTSEIVDEINRAESEILLQAYSFTSQPIVQALINAHKRGIKVLAILDKSQRSERYTAASSLANDRIPTFIDDKHAIAHNKIIIIDGTTTITGSFNFTKAAQERNAENLLIIKSPDIAKTYAEKWHTHKEHSEAYQPR